MKWPPALQCWKATTQKIGVYGLGHIREDPHNSAVPTNCMASVSSNNLNSISQCLLPILRIQRLPSIPTVASIYLLMIPLIWESFSTCCCRSRLSLSSRRFWYCRRILLVCCSCTRSRRSYSSSFLWDIRSRSFRALISSSYSRT